MKKTITNNKTGIILNLIPGGDEVKSFWMGKYTVTNEQYLKFIEDQCLHKDLKNEYYKLNPTLPIVNISWNAAKEFCNWSDLRLPTEKEWEYACRAGSEDDYYFGNDKSLLNKYAWYLDNCNSICSVGLKIPNKFGLFDMHGNIGEWCKDIKVLDRVHRGGSWINTAENCRSLDYNLLGPTDRDDYLGFRVALDL